MRPTSDAWENPVARALVADLTDRGVDLQVRAGLLRVDPITLVRPDEVQVIRQHRDAMIVIVLACTDQVLDRLLEMRAGRLAQAMTTAAGHCHVCGEHLPDDRQHGRCGWCAVASRLYAGAPLSPDLLSLFPADVRGPAVPTTLGGALPFDVAVPA